MSNFLFVLMAVFCVEPVWAGGGTIEAIGGSPSVLVKRDGQELRLKKGDKLNVGDELVTDKVTAADIRLEDKTLLRIGESSSYQLKEDTHLKSFLHRLINGAVRVLVPERADQNAKEIRFRMSTPEGTIGVRGTEFVVFRENGETKLRDITGTVLFGPADVDFSIPSQFVSVTKGYESVMKNGAKAATKPVKYPSSFLKEINSRKGVFGALADRNLAEFRARESGSAASNTVAGNEKEAPKAGKKLAKGAAKFSFTKQPEKKDLPPNEWLLLATASGDQKLIKQLLEERGAEINYKDADGNTALHAAVVMKQEDTVKFLIERGANVNVKNREGRTPLMLLALVAPVISTARILVQKGADDELKDNQGMTALDIALARMNNGDSEEPYEEFVDFLKKGDM